MPQLSPLNWITLFFLFWFLFLNSSIMWWNNKNSYILMNQKMTKMYMYNWLNDSSHFFFVSWS